MRRSMLTALLVVASTPGNAIQGVLAPGALPSDCESALRVGIVICGQVTPDKDRDRSPSEAQVTEYLAEYGKPPREAVRALLEPNDANIAAWLRKQRQVISIASYVANRMTEMQSQFENGTQSLPPLPVSKESALIQMRATLYLDVTNIDSRQALKALQTVVARYPSIDGRLVQAGRSGHPFPPSSLLRLDTVLPISVLAIDALDGVTIPSLLIEDLRTGRSLRVGASGVTPQEICDQIVALRQAAEPIGRSSEFSPGSHEAK